MRSQGRPSHHLVGVAVEGDAPLAPGDELSSDGKRVGEITSSCRSAAAGQIALAYVRRAFSEPGTELAAAGTVARVASLPFVAATAVRGDS